MTTKLLVTAGAAAALLLSGAAPASPVTGSIARVRTLVIAYEAHNGETSHATVLVPSWYGPHRNPPLPLVISPHGRGLWGSTNAKLWGNLPGRHGFAVVNPDGEGEHLSGRFAWGAPGDVDDLARMPELVREAIPWLRIDQKRIYAVGGSMGGQETLLLIGRHPHLLAGAVAVDPAVDMVRRYHDFDSNCRRLARHEVGGKPASVPRLYAQRTVFTYERAIASSGVKLEIWWSRKDRIIKHSPLQSGLLVEHLQRLNPEAPLDVHTGTWKHTYPLRYDRQLPRMLAELDLVS